MTGKWKIKALATFVPEEGLKKISLDEVNALPDGPEKEELLSIAKAVLDISETKMSTLMAIPADQLEAAKASGAPVTDDGYIVMEECEVKVENGVFFYKNSTQGSIMGEEIDPWQKIELNADGDFELNPMMTFTKL